MDISQLSRKERVNLVPLLLGNRIDATIIEQGAIKITGRGHEFATDCDTFALWLDGKQLAKDCVFWEDVVDQSAAFIPFEHHEDFRLIEEILSEDCYDWQECVVASLDNN